MRVLIAYPSKACSIRETAGFIGEKLRDSGMHAGVVDVDSVKDLNGYDASVIGSALYYQVPRPEKATQFVSSNRAIPAACSIWIFSRSRPTSNKATDSKGRDLREESGPKEREQIRAWVIPRDRRAFSGASNRDNPKGMAATMSQLSLRRAYELLLVQAADIAAPILILQYANDWRKKGAIESSNKKPPSLDKSSRSFSRARR
jgi:menaquinone-dependent protoporphyrinogen oxidase